MTGAVFLALVLPLLVGANPVDEKVFPTDCSDHFDQGRTLSGVYTIYDTPDTPVQVYCSMDSEGNQTEDRRQWTVIQRRMDGTENFYRPWNDYKKGFGSKHGEYWWGLENIHKFTTRTRRYELRVDLEDFEGKRVYAHYGKFSVESEAQGYRLNVDGFTNGGAGDSLTNSNGQKFSTFDKDQDWHQLINCAQTSLGGFWYTACGHTNPNGIYLWGKDGTYPGIGNMWMLWKGYDYGLKTITMKIRRVKRAQ